MEGRRRLSRASSASISISDRRRSFDAGSLHAPRSRPASANSCKSYFPRNELQSSTDRGRIPMKQKWALATHDLSPNVKRAIAIAANQAYKNIQQVFYEDSSSERVADVTKQETFKDLMLDRFLEKIRRVKSGEISREQQRPGSTHQPGSTNSGDINYSGHEHRHGLLLDSLINQVRRSTNDAADGRSRRPGSATSDRASLAKAGVNNSIDLRKQPNISSCDTADAIIERRERIRNRSMHIEQHVLEARERIRRAKIRREAEIHAITAALESNQIDQEKAREAAVQIAKQRLWKWRAQHRGDDSDPVYKYKTAT